MKLIVACLTVGLAASHAVSTAVTAMAPTTGYFIKAADNRVVGAIYTPHVWSGLLSSSQHDGSGSVAGGASSQPLVRIAFRDPKGPQRSEALSQAPWRLALVDAYEVLSWEQPEAQHPVWLTEAAAVAAQTGITELSKFTVLGGFKPEQLTGRKFVTIYRSARKSNGGVETEFHAERLPDPSTLQWR